MAGVRFEGLSKSYPGRDGSGPVIVQVLPALVRNAAVFFRSAFISAATLPPLLRMKPVNSSRWVTIILTP